MVKAKTYTKTCMRTLFTHTGAASLAFEGAGLLSLLFPRENRHRVNFALDG
jgi:hypothetical protein